MAVLLENHPDFYIDGNSVGISLVREMQTFKRRYADHPAVPPAELFGRLCEKSYKGRLAALLQYKAFDQYPTIRALLADSVNQFARENGKVVWGDKTPELIFHLPELLELFPNARIIQMVRDARPNASSLVKRQYYPLELAAQYWKEINGLGLATQSLIGREQFRLVKYEDLLSQPEQTLRELCTFLGRPFDPGILKLAESEATQQEGAYVGSTLDASRTESWKEQLAPATVQKIEGICGDLMDQLGYACQNANVAKKARSLSYRRRFWLRQKMMFGMLMKGRRVQMIDRKLIRAKVPFRQRLKNFTFGTISHVFSADFIRMFNSRYR